VLLPTPELTLYHPSYVRRGVALKPTVICSVWTIRKRFGIKTNSKLAFLFGSYAAKQTEIGTLLVIISKTGERLWASLTSS
jgi:hypothetical protein